MRRKVHPFWIVAAILIGLNASLELAALEIRHWAEKYNHIEGIAFSHGLFVSLNPWITNLIHTQLPLQYAAVHSTGCGHLTYGCFFSVSWLYASCMNEDYSG